MSQIYGQEIIPGQPTRWQPIAAVKQPDNTYAIKVDTELVLDAANINLANMKIGSVNQTSATLRYVKVLDDGTVVVEASPLDSYEIADLDDGNDPLGSNYFGYTTLDEDWYILEENKAGPTPTYRYFKGVGGYVAAWTGRAGHAYNYFHIIF